MRLSRALALLLLLPVAACGISQEPERPRAFDAVSADVPDGWHTELCPGAGFTVRVAVPPPGNRWGSLTDDGCGWRYQDTSLGVSVAEPTSLEAYREKYLDPYEDGGGDDSVERIELTEDVPVFGDQEGDQLDWYSFSDGSPTENRILQAAGVRVHWSTPAGQDKRHDDLQTVLDSIEVLPGERHQCRRGEKTVSYELPDALETVDSFGGKCHAYFPDATSLERHAEVVVAPTRSLEQYAAELRRSPGVRDVRIEEDAVELAGERVDRLTWRFVRTRESQNYEPAGTWLLEAVGDERVRVEWGATPREWDEERATVQRFIGSVRLP